MVLEYFEIYFVLYFNQMTLFAFWNDIELCNFHTQHAILKHMFIVEWLRLA